MNQFLPEKFISPGWSFHERMLIPPFELADVSVVINTTENESASKVIMKIIEEGFTPIGADAYQYFWENKDKIPEHWKETAGKNGMVLIFGADILESPKVYGNPIFSLKYVCGIYWQEERWNFTQIEKNASYGCSAIVYKK